MKVAILGASGMVGSALRRIIPGALTPSRRELDLDHSHEAMLWMREHRPDVVYLCAARVGGIGGNAADPSGYLVDNLHVSLNSIEAAFEAGVKRLLYFGSSCIYPGAIDRSIYESDLMSRPLEPTNEGYALGKIVGTKLCSYLREQYGVEYATIMPCNLYGPRDNFGEDGHVLPSLVKRFVEAVRLGAREVTVWGTGRPLRELMHVDDLARAAVLYMECGMPWAMVNCGFGEDYRILDIADRVALAVNYRGNIVMDLSKPDGTQRKLLDSTRIRSLGWEPKIRLTEGIKQMVDIYRDL